MKYKLIKSFKGSPDGAHTIEFDKPEIEHSELGDDLAQVAMNEDWIEPIESEVILGEPEPEPEKPQSETPKRGKR